MNGIMVEPEMLGRSDTEHGRWNVDTCNPRRGEPYTDIVGREMKVPAHDTALARCIRAHEMMHAKVSPAGDWKQWVDRKFASKESMTVVEELRVNFLCQKAGFDVKGNLMDGGETADGERCAGTNDWTSAVRMSFATAGTASNKAFLNGVRRHNRKWGEILADISKRAVKEMEKAYKTRTLASTEVDRGSGLFPFGFSHTERIAEWVDRLCATPPQDEEEESSASGEGEGEGEGNGEGEKKSNAEHGGRHSNKGAMPKVGSATGKPYPKITPSEMTLRIPAWGKLVVENCPMPKHTKGNIGKKRIASNMGKAPRRMHRLLTDPEKRVFDKVTRGNGGVVIIDGSGSMSFNHDQIRAIVENAPGATVAVYTDKDHCKGAPNMWVVADKGRMVAELPEFGHGNGVDFPALEWAVEHRQRSSSPIIWVTDGGVCPPMGGYTDALAMQCIMFCKKNNIIVLPYVEEAVRELKKMKSGNKGKSQWPHQLKWAYKEATGQELA
jgi:hypothetical protein